MKTKKLIEEAISIADKCPRHCEEGGKVLRQALAELEPKDPTDVSEFVKEAREDIALLGSTECKTVEDLYRRTAVQALDLLEEQDKTIEKQAEEIAKLSKDG